MRSDKMDILVFGLGPIGIKMIHNCLQSNAIRVIGAVDIHPDIIGKDIGELADLGPVGVSVVKSLRETQAVEASGRKIAIHATGSNLERVWPQIRELIDHGYSVISTCEQLSYPWHRYPELSRTIDQYAKSKGQFVIGTGINPGFVMDTLAIVATTVTQKVKRIVVTRSVDVSKRRIPLQQKVGIGMTPEHFRSLAEEDKIGHVGLEESLRLIAYGLNLTLTEVRNTIDPMIASDDKQLAVGLMRRGEVSGLHQTSNGSTKEGVPIELDLTMSVDAEQRDTITLETEELGLIELVIPGGIFGDTATVNVVVNTAKTLYACEESGLLTMADIRLTRNAG